MHTLFKYIRRAFLGLLLSIAFIYGSLYLLLSLSPVQQTVKNIALHELRSITGTDLNIQKIQIRPFNKVTLEGVLIPDLQQDTLLYAHKLSAGFEWLPLLNKQIRFTTIQMIGFDIRLTKADPAADPNFKFFIDAFASKDKSKKNKHLDLRLGSVMLRRGKFSYDLLSEAHNGDKFDAKHIAVSDIGANISLRALTQDSLDIVVKRLSLEEQSGLKIEKLALKLRGNREEALLSDLSMKLPQSKIRIDSVFLDYSHVTEKAGFADSTRFRLVMPESDIALRDMSAFAPALRYFNSPLTLQMHAMGSVNNIDIPEIRVTYGNELQLRANASLMGISNPKEAYLFGQVADLTITPEGISGIVNNFSSDKKDLPQVLNKLGTIRFNGDISGFFSNLVAYGKIHTRLGTLRADVLLGNDLTNHLLTYKGTISTSGFKVKQLLREGNPLGDLSFALKVDGRQQRGFVTQGVVKGTISSFDFKEYRYRNLELDGNYHGKSFDGSIRLNDPNGYLLLEGKTEIARQGSSFHFSAKARGIKLDKLKLVPAYKESDLGFNVEADFVGNQFDNAQGTLQIDSLSFSNNGTEFFLDSLLLNAYNHQEPQVMELKSDLVSGQLSGSYSFRSLINEFRNNLAEIMPVLKQSSASPRTNVNDFDFALQVNNTEKLSAVLGLPVILKQPITFSGSYSSAQSRFHMDGIIPEMQIGKMIFEEGSLTADMPGDRVLFRLNTRKLNKNNQLLFLSLNADAQNGILKTKFDWSNLAAVTYSGNFETETRFNKLKGKYPLQTNIRIKPSTLIFNDSIWTVNPATAVIDSGRVRIQDFEIKHKNQHLKLGGTLSKMDSDSLKLNLHEMNLDYIFQTLNINYVQFGGLGTGDFLLTHNEKNPIIKTDNFNVKNFSYNGAHLGDISLYSDWDNKNKGIFLKGIITQPDALPTVAQGSIFIGNDSLWLNFDANRLNINFIRMWTDNILQNARGRASGKLTLFGKFKTLSIIGDAFAEDVSFDVGYLNTTYSTSDTVRFRKDGISFKNISIYDRSGNRAFADGKISYEYFKDIRYDISMHIPDNQSFQVFNLTEKLSPVYWGTIYASGSGRIYGDVKKTWIDVSARTKPNSKFNFSLNENLTAGDYKFITFFDKNSEEQAANDSITEKLHALPKYAPAETDHDINLNLQVEATPDGTINLIMDPASGDVIKGTGAGNIRLEYNKTTDFRLYGNYTIEKGSYYFNLQDVITRDFTINQGSSVNFRGNPLSAELDIQAYYQVTANLTDLDESFAESRELSRPNVPVRCILNINGDLRRPDLSFDINLPTVSQDIDRQVKSIISTDDMMNRQILYLMILNKFYTPEMNTGQQNRYGELASVASSTLSSQLNNLLGQLSDNWNIGTNIRSDKGDFSDVEVELALSSQLLNNRLLLNGNLGYRDNPNANNSFVGDFDLEYLLNPAGSLRLKAYNHYNDRNYSVKSALTTQGVGVVFKKDFNNFTELFQVFRKRKREIQKPTKAAAPE